MVICWECPLGVSLVFIFSAVFVVRVPFPFGIWGRVWNSIVSVPDHCLLSSLNFKNKNSFLSVFCKVFAMCPRMCR